MSRKRFGAVYEKRAVNDGSKRCHSECTRRDKAHMFVDPAAHEVQDALESSQATLHSVR